MIRLVRPAAALLLLSVASGASAQGRTDVVRLGNGDRITGEVVRLDRGRLEYKTDDAGTLYLEWDKLLSVVAARNVEVVTTAGLRFVGSLGHSTDRVLDVHTLNAVINLPMPQVTRITPVGERFWRQLDGSIDSGFSYTKSSGIATLNLNSDTIYRKPAFSGRITASTTITQTDDEEGRDDRGYIEGSYLRYPWQQWFILIATRFETNQSLGLVLRSQVGGTVGPRLVDSNRAQFSLGAGMAFNDERGVDVEPTQNVEGILTLRASYFTYDQPKTNLDVSLAYYPSISNLGRQPMQLDAGIRRELLKDFFVSLSGYDSYDSRPPNPAADTNDVGIVFSLGWSY